MAYSRIRLSHNRCVKQMLDCKAQPPVRNHVDPFPRSTWHMPIPCVQKKFQNKSLNTHRPHSPASSICSDVVCGAAEAPCIILTGAFPHPTCSCQWARQQTKAELAYKKEQLVSVNIQAHWTGKATVVHTCSLTDMINLRLPPPPGPPGSLAVLILDLAS